MSKKEPKMKKKLKDVPLVPLPEVPETENQNSDFSNVQTLNQKKIALAQSVHAPIVIELLKDVLKKIPLIGKDQWETMKNAIIIDTSSEILRDLVDHLEKIKRGSLIGEKQ